MAGPDRLAVLDRHRGEAAPAGQVHGGGGLKWQLDLRQSTAILKRPSDSPTKNTSVFSTQESLKSINPEPQRRQTNA
eukprot:5402924-Alexandrium_andersonii.AAC.1